MRRILFPLLIGLGVLLVAAQFLIPPLLEHHAESQLTEHGGSADVQLSAIPSVELLFGHGDNLELKAHGLSVDLDPSQKDVFKRLDNFGAVRIAISDSRAGPFTISNFRIERIGPNRYAVAASGNGNASDVARYAGGRLAGDFGQALAGLAATALGGFTRPIPFDATMVIDTSSGSPEASSVDGSVGGLPAGPLAQIVANALLGVL